MSALRKGRGGSENSRLILRMSSTDRLREMRKGGPKSQKCCGRLLSIAPMPNVPYACDPYVPLNSSVCCVICESAHTSILTSRLLCGGETKMLPYAHEQRTGPPRAKRISSVINGPGKRGCRCGISVWCNMLHLINII